MTNAPITILKRSDIDHAMNDLAPKSNAPKIAAAIETRPSGVLKELALARWRGSATQVPGPPRTSDHQDR